MYSVPMFPWQHMSVWAVTPVGTGVILVCVCVCVCVHAYTLAWAVSSCGQGGCPAPPHIISGTHHLAGPRGGAEYLHAEDRGCQSIPPLEPTSSPGPA